MKPLRSKDLGQGRYEVEGVIFYANSHPEALRKYLRQKRKSNTDE